MKSGLCTVLPAFSMYAHIKKCQVRHTTGKLTKKSNLHRLGIVPTCLMIEVFASERSVPQ